MTGPIVAMGGYHPDLVRFAVGLAGRDRPRLLYVPTAQGDDSGAIERFYARAPDWDVDPDHLGLFGIPDRPQQRVTRADVILVNGGNTANMLAVWRVHGIDSALAEAWQRGAVLAGWSAGANCWFRCSVTDSFGSALMPLRDGLGLLEGSFCPHYDGQEQRRPAYEALAADGFPPGLACDDGAAVVFTGTELTAAVSAVEGARAWRVDERGSTVLTTRALA